MKTVLITGGNKGIGFEIARQMGALGWQVFLGARNPERGKLAVETLRKNGATVTFIEMDVSKSDSIEAAFQTVRDICPNLDVLINNAGILLRDDRSILKASERMIAEVLQTNAIGPLAVVQTFRPLLSSGGRIIMVSSEGGSMDAPIGGWSPVYCISKTLLNSITRHLDYTLKPDGILVNAMCPGWVKTDMGGKSAPGSVEEGAATAVWLATVTTLPASGVFWKNMRVIPW